nr:uncharacterized protein LOC104084594 [Nicotiana tomentosiformis]XP_009620283.1 uncharacterized protein LOC104112144 [Nicotiana tomentosiformis]
MSCPHALAVVTKEGKSAYEYCSVYFSIDYMLKTYEQEVFPISNESNWDIPREILEEVVLPPVGQVQPGRLKKCRWQTAAEIQSKKSKVSCGICGQYGHNRKTCRNLLKRD